MDNLEIEALLDFGVGVKGNVRTDALELTRDLETFKTPVRFIRFLRILEIRNYTILKKLLPTGKCYRSRAQTLTMHHDQQLNMTPFSIGCILGCAMPTADVKKKLKVSCSLIY